jgi:hypothetical protein
VVNMRLSISHHIVDTQALGSETGFNPVAIVPRPFMAEIAAPTSNASRSPSTARLPPVNAR